MRHQHWLPQPRSKSLQRDGVLHAADATTDAADAGSDAADASTDATAAVRLRQDDLHVQRRKEGRLHFKGGLYGKLHQANA